MPIAPGILLGALNKAEWHQPAARRRALRAPQRLHRYGLSLRSPQALTLETCIDFRLHDLESLRWYIGHPFFSGIAVLVERQIVLEHYAPEVGAGYARTTVQDALDMALVNDYSEDVYNPSATVGRLGCPRVAARRDGGTVG